MKTKTNEEKFAKLRADFTKLAAEREDFRVTLAVKYGSGYQRSWWKTAEESKLDKYNERLNKIEEKFFELLEAISPRSWQTGMSAAWVMTELTYADAVTSGELSTMPRPSTGSTEYDMRRFMRPVG